MPRQHKKNHQKKLFQRPFLKTYLARKRQEIEQHPDSSALLNMVGFLNKKKLLTRRIGGKLIDMLLSHTDLNGLQNALTLMSGFSLLNGPLSRSNLLALINHKRPWAMVGGLEALKHNKDNPLDDRAQMLFNLLVGQPDPWHAIEAIQTLQENKLFTYSAIQACISGSAREQDLRKVAYVWVLLKKYCNVSDSTLHDLITLQPIHFIPEALEVLQVDSLLSHPIVQQYIAHVLTVYANQAVSLAHILRVLGRLNLLTEKNVSLLFPFTSSIASTSLCLNQIENLRNVLSTIENSELLHHASHNTRREMMQQKLEQLIKYADLLLSEQVPWKYVSTLRPYNFEAHFTSMLRIAESKEDPDKKLEAVQSILKPSKSEAEKINKNYSQCQSFVDGTKSAKWSAYPKARQLSHFWSPPAPKTPLVSSPVISREERKTSPASVFVSVAHSTL